MSRKGRWVVGRARLGKGAKARRERNQEPPARLATAPAAYTAARPRDPTASWKEESPKGNPGSSSSLSRTGKLEKATGLVWAAVWE